MRRLARASLVGAAVAVAAARLWAAQGLVFDDLNKDGVWEPDEPGLADVAVSNGVEVVRTDGNGHYRLPDRAGAHTFVIKPRGWRPPADAQNIPRYYGRPQAGEVLNFALVPHLEPDQMTAVVTTDTQPSTPAEVDFLKRGLVDRIGHRPDFAFGVTLGDLVYDRPDLFGAVSGALAQVGTPWYNVAGNHDLRLGTPDEATAVAAFESAYGPSTFAFHAGPALFVGLDDVRPQGGPRYVGGLREDQFEFLAHLLELSPPSEWVVIMLHIPLFPPDPSGTEGFRTADRLRLFGLLRGRERVLVLSGHTHYQRHVLHDASDGWTGKVPLHEYNVAAACGGFWGGPADANGIPVATMWDGTPPGYALMAFSGDRVTLDYVPARTDRQIALHVPASLRPGQGYVSFYANVFNGYDGWTVESRVDERAWGPLRRILGWDPSYADAFLAQDAAAHPSKGTRLPDPVVCYHLWRGILPADLAPGRHTVHVRATDPDGRASSADQTFEIVRD